MIRFQTQWLVLPCQRYMSQTRNDRSPSPTVTPVCVEASLDETFGRRVNLPDVRVRGQGEEDESDLRVFVRFGFELSVGQERVKYPKVGMAALSRSTINYQRLESGTNPTIDLQPRSLPVDPPILSERRLREPANRWYKSTLGYPPS
jgi:hypothetical protein